MLARISFFPFLTVVDLGYQKYFKEGLVGSIWEEQMFPLLRPAADSVEEFVRSVAKCNLRFPSLFEGKHE